MNKCPNCKKFFKASERAIYCNTSCRNSAYQKRLRAIALFHKTAKHIKIKEPDLASLRGAMLAINPSKNELWEEVGQSLANAVFMKEISEKNAFDFWMNWSKLKKDFDVVEAKEKWLSFKPPSKFMMENLGL